VETDSAFLASAAAPNNWVDGTTGCVVLVGGKGLVFINPRSYTRNPKP